MGDAGAGGGMSAAGNGAGGGGAGNLDAVVPSAGCNMPPNQNLNEFVRYTMQTSGTKDPGATGNEGPWAYEREYFVWLPADYDNTRAYQLVLQGPGCGSNGTAVFPLSPPGGSPGNNNNVIRVGVTPPPNAINHTEAPNAGCFDDKEGDDSVDWIYYENLIDWLDTRFCFDRNRVFASGNSSGAWWGNELACIYSGHATYPIRGIGVNTGGLPPEGPTGPTCVDNPMSGLWIHAVNDTVNPFSGNIRAIERAMTVNGCESTDYANAPKVDYPIGGNNQPDTCKLISGCPAEYPLVVCALPGNDHDSHDSVANPAITTYLNGFAAE